MKPRPSLMSSAYALSLALALASPLNPLAAALPRIQLEVVASGQIVSPVGITNAGDGSGRLFIVDQRGQIHILNDEDMVLPTPFLDISANLVPERAGFDERGLLSVAFHPDYATAAAAGEGKFYVYYSAPSPNAPGTTTDPVDHMSVIAEYQVSTGNADIANPASARILLTFDQPQFNHDGGQLAFGADGFLYISTGDGGSADDNRYGHTGGNSNTQPTDALGNSQDTSKLLGKILRVDVFGNNGSTGQYGIPASNPFAASAGSERKEIFVYGLRNPWRFSFDDGTGGSGDLFCADVGQGKFEEVNIIDPGPGGDAGGNYGWRIKEGSSLFVNSTLPDPGNLIDPVAEYAHIGQGVGGLLEIGSSITGGHVYRGSSIPALNGIYFLADWSNGFAAPGAGTLLGMESDGMGGWDIAVFDVAGGNPLSYFINAIGEDEDGELYIAGKTVLAAGGLDPDSNLPTGTILRVHAAQPSSMAVLGPLKDNSIYEEAEDRSSGIGDSLFAGTTDDVNTNQFERRALLAFDAGSIPAGSLVDSASLKLRVTRTPIPPIGPGLFNLHRVERDWGEGTSNGSGTGAPSSAGDATWRYSLFNTVEWTFLGGDFQSNSSAMADAGNSMGDFVLSSAGMADDVQSWVEDPAGNFGWILIGGPEVKTARRFGSREHANASTRPQLTVEYTGPLPLTRRQEWLREFFPPGTFVDDTGDLDGEDIVNLFEYGFALDPTVANSSPDIPDASLINGELVFTFRRDPRATDMTYRIEFSNDLEEESWTMAAESTGGAATAGPGFVSETAIVGEEPLVLVTAKDPVGGPRRFVRIVMIRTH